mmetsp:Transcript_2185/g.3664  ORF Transcript_2185/g.3664 Transcript_2185/m.3664 type:complete len:207 (-) Transcript_2185:103-723(-)
MDHGRLLDSTFFLQTIAQMTIFITEFERFQLLIHFLVILRGDIRMVVGRTLKWITIVSVLVVIWYIPHIIPNDLSNSFMVKVMTVNHKALSNVCSFEANHTIFCRGNGIIEFSILVISTTILTGNLHVVQVGMEWMENRVANSPLLNFIIANNASRVIRIPLHSINLRFLIILISIESSSCAKECDNFFVVFINLCAKPACHPIRL